jgi:hypothetical protein
MLPDLMTLLAWLGQVLWGFLVMCEYASAPNPGQVSILMGNGCAVFIVAYTQFVAQVGRAVLLFLLGRETTAKLGLSTQCF